VYDVRACLRAVGHVVHTLPIRQPVIGVASINDTICVLRKKQNDVIEVYDAATYDIERFMCVPDATVFGLVDITACETNQCLYLANSPDKRVHRQQIMIRNQGQTGRFLPTNVCIASKL